jgi:hypothetical protein
MAVIRSMKPGNYMKISPQTVFAAQVARILISWLVQTAVNLWALSNVKGICSGASVGDVSHFPSIRILSLLDVLIFTVQFLCTLTSRYKTSIIFWGLIGPQKLFSSGAFYNSILYFFLIGAILPIIVILAAHRWPGSWVKYIHVPIIMSSTADIPPATAGNYMSWAFQGLAFQY